LRFTHGLAGLHRGRITIEDAPIQFDDDLYFGYDVRDEIRILHITDDANSEASRSIERVYQSAENLYRLNTVTTWSPRELEDEQLVLVSGVSSPSSGLIQTLATFVDQGGSVCYMPERTSSDPQFFQAFDGQSKGSWISVSDRVSTLETSHPFFTGVFDSQPERLNLPTISELWHRETSAREEVLASTLLGHAFFSRLTFGKGTVYFLGTSPDPSCSNVTRHALWVPLLLRMAEQSKATPVMWGVIGQKAPIAVAAEPDAIESVSFSGPIAPAAPVDQSISKEPNWLPEARVIQGRTSIEIGNLNLDPGHYRVRFGAKDIALFGINQNRQESDHRAFTVAEFQAQWAEWNWSHVDVVQASAASLSEAIDRLEKGNPVWFLFMYIALFALFVESFLLRSWKRSS
jgi:hypothetical protein